MKASELVKELQDLISKHGDLEVAKQDDRVGDFYRVGARHNSNESFIEIVERH